ncbi:tonB-system energizer ExbB [Pseudogemmobacter sonorensis]|uniref:tonB-system energizer ExbB n=1 Tax=Pseudogemmobacter sonorensis TaxID=2989681 RepID=UPI0036B6D735
MRNALIILLLSLAAPAVAQDGGAPVVSSEAPEQSGAPTEEPAADLPSLPTEAEGVVREGNVPATPATTDAAGPVPAAEVPAPAAEVPAPAAEGQEPAPQPTADAAAGDAPAAAEGAATATEGTVQADAPAGTTAPTADIASDAAGADAAPAEGGAAAAVPHSADLWEIVMQAHWVVMAVMVGLAIAAFVALVIFIHKTIEFAAAFSRLNRTARTLSAATSLDAARSATARHRGPAADMIRAATEELEAAQADPVLAPGVRERTASALGRIEAGAAHGLRSGTGVLASIGSLAPFVGLFGTVFGIMNSFLAIAESKTTSLAVVAPGIAEALFATAIGLAAAIPAVLIYNICSRRLAKFRLRLNDVGAAAERLQSHALDRLAAQEG